MIDAVLIDDDPLIHMVWGMEAKTAGKTLLTFKGTGDFRAVAKEIPPNVPIYIDSDLGEGMRGEEFARELHSLGYENIFLSTGHSPDSLPAMPWIRAVVGKESPWT